MAIYLYLRVSTDNQDFIQQHKCVTDFLSTQRINLEKDVKQCVVEKISGTVNHNERKLSQLLGKCKCNDTIYFSELSRLGRNMVDLNNIVNECCERGIVLIQCKDGMKIENESIGGKALLFALSLAAEIEVKNIRQRTQMSIDARKKLLVDHGEFISKTGRRCTRLGRPADYVDENGKAVYDLSAAHEASSKAKQDAAIEWRDKSVGYKWVMRRYAEGMSRKEIIRLFNEQHAEQPDVFCTPKGKPLSAGTLSHWISEANPLVLVG